MRAPIDPLVAGALRRSRFIRSVSADVMGVVDLMPFGPMVVDDPDGAVVVTLGSLVVVVVDVDCATATPATPMTDKAVMAEMRRRDVFMRGTP